MMGKATRNREWKREILPHRSWIWQVPQLRFILVQCWNLRSLKTRATLSYLSCSWSRGWSFFSCHSYLPLFMNFVIKPMWGNTATPETNTFMSIPTQLKFWVRWTNFDFESSQKWRLVKLGRHPRSEKRKLTDKPVQQQPRSTCTCRKCQYQVGFVPEQVPRIAVVLGIETPCFGPSPALWGLRGDGLHHPHVVDLLTSLGEGYKGRLDGDVLGI